MTATHALVVIYDGVRYLVPVGPDFDIDAHTDGDWLHTPGGSFLVGRIQGQPSVIKGRGHLSTTTTTG